jgi:hypothetical protein
VTTNAGGTASFNVTLMAPVSPGQFITATATNLTPDPSAQAMAVNTFSTSEFSPALRIPLPPAPPVAPPPVFFITKQSRRGTLVEVFDGRTGMVLFSFVPFKGFHGRVHVAVGDVNDDGILDVIVGTGPGGSGRVVVVDGRTHAVLDSFPPVGASFRRDVVVASADINRDGFADVLVVKRQRRSVVEEVFDGKSLARGLVVLLETLTFNL